MKAKKWLGIGLALVMSVSMCSLFAACGETNGDTVTVKWYDGRTELKSIEVEKGSTVEDWLPVKDGYDFKGWFAEASFAQPWEASTTIEKNTAIFSRWRTQNPTEDTRFWYARGSIMTSSWTQLTTFSEKKQVWEKSVGPDTVADVERLFFTKSENAPSNTFEITLDLTTGYWKSKKWQPSKKFRFVTNMWNADWTGDAGCAQMGLGNLIGFEFASGMNPEKGTNVKKDQYLYGEVRDANGNLVFYGGYEYNNPSYTWNIYTAEEMAGVYKFTFRSFPGNETTHEVTWERIAYLAHDFVDGGVDGSVEKNGRCDECGRTQAEHEAGAKPTGPKNQPLA